MELKIGITLGDQNGVGPESVIKIFRDSRMHDMATFVLYGSTKALSFYKPTIEGGEAVAYNVVRSAKEAAPRKLNIVECAKGEVRITPGEASAEAGGVAIESLRRAVEDVKAGAIDLLVTAPINKNSMNAEGFGATGHTEFLAKEFDGEPLMIMTSELMRVGLATIHVPVAQVAERLSKELIVDRIEQMNTSMKQDFGVVEPRIAVLSLNPHAGDGGLLGSEEENIIRPAIIEAANQGVLAFGPLAADGLFAGGGYKKYDAILAMYHDQGLTPFKALSPEGVNFTAGLNIVRTSPDHGTAFDIAGKDLADAQSMRNAIYEAIDIVRRRSDYNYWSRNPLEHFEREKGRDVSLKDLKDLPEKD